MINEKDISGYMEKHGLKSIDVRVESEQLPNFQFSLNVKDNKVDIKDEHESMLKFIIASYLKIRRLDTVKKIADACNDDIIEEVISGINNSSIDDLLGISENSVLSEYNQKFREVYF